MLPSYVNTSLAYECIKDVLLVICYLLSLQTKLLLKNKIFNKGAIQENMNEFEQYKERLQGNDFFIGWQKQVSEILSQKNLYPVMNDTKWMELQKAIDSLPFPPPFIIKCVTDDDNPTEKLEDAPRWLGDWSSYWEEGLPPFFDIEWMKIRPRHGKYRGRLIADEVLDETDGFIAILEKLSIPFENESGTLTIHGYK